MHCCGWAPEATIDSAALNNRLQLSGVLEGVFDNLAAGGEYVLLALGHLLLLLREIYAALLCNPPTRLRKLNNSAL